MKSLINSQIQQRHEQHSPSSLLKKWIELQHTNKQRQILISKLQKEVAELESAGQQLDDELKNQKEELEQYEDKEKQMSEEDEQQMNNWIENVQKYSGLPQQAINSLVTIEFEGGEQQICLSCYQELNAGMMCTYLPCCHLFHKECIGNHLKVNKMCPACQEIVAF